MDIGSAVTMAHEQSQWNLIVGCKVIEEKEDVEHYPNKQIKSLDARRILSYMSRVDMCV